MIWEGLKFEGVKFGAFDFSEILGVYCYLNAGFGTTKPVASYVSKWKDSIQGLEFLTIPGATLNQYPKISFFRGLPFVNFYPQGRGMSLTDTSLFNFLHTGGQKWTVYVVDRAELEGVGSGNRRLLVGNNASTTNMITREVGFGAYIYQTASTDPVGTQSYQVGIPGIITVGTPVGSRVPGAIQVLKIKYYRIGSTNYLKVYINNVLVAETTNTTTPRPIGTPSTGGMELSHTNQQHATAEFLVINEQGQDETLTAQQLALVDLNYQKYYA